MGKIRIIFNKWGEYRKKKLKTYHRLKKTDENNVLKIGWGACASVDKFLKTIKYKERKAD